MQKKKMRITILGCGTSTGVPLLHCPCAVCRSKNPKNNRLRASILVEWQGDSKTKKSFLIDVSPDFRQQAMREKIKRVDAILFTHPHADQVGGIDEIRSFNFIQRERIPAYGHAWTLDQLPKRFPYIFLPTKIEGGGVAQIDLNSFDLNRMFFASGVPIQAISLDHGSEQVAGFRIGNFAYLTDFHRISEDSLNLLKGLDRVVIDCLRLEPHSTHVNFDQSLDYATRIAAKQTYLTHLGHDFDYGKFSKKLPRSVSMAYDGLVFQSN